MPDQDDFSMAYQDSCSGLTLLLIHGFPFSSAMWEPQIDELSDIVRVIAPDLRGHGFSDAVSGPYTMTMLAEDCLGLLESIGVQEPVVVCGLSMGGYIAFEFYRRYPERVAGLILAATRAGADSEEGKANRDKMAATVHAAGSDAIAQAMLPKILAPDAYDEDEPLVPFLEEMMRATSVEGIVGALAAMKERPDSTPTLARIRVPTLVIHGNNDQIIPPAEAEAMAQAIPDAELVLIDDAGHLPNLEQPDEFNAAVWSFLEDLQEASHDRDHDNGRFG